MHGATLIDKNKNVLRPCILWNDTRSANQCIEMEDNYKEHALWFKFSLKYKIYFEILLSLKKIVSHL